MEARAVDTKACTHAPHFRSAICTSSPFLRAACTAGRSCSQASSTRNKQEKKRACKQDTVSKRACTLHRTSGVQSAPPHARRVQSAPRTFPAIRCLAQETRTSHLGYVKHYLGTKGNTRQWHSTATLCSYGVQSAPPAQRYVAWAPKNPGIRSHTLPCANLHHGSSEDLWAASPKQKEKTDSAFQVAGGLGESRFVA